MVREYQRVIGKEARAQILAAEGRLPDAAIACVGGGSNAMGLFADFIDDAGVRLIGVEAGRQGARRRRAWRDHPARPAGRPPRRRNLCAAGRGRPDQRELVGLGRASIIPRSGPEHAFLKDSGRAEYVGATDREALDAFALLARTEGIVCAFESAHALAHALKLADEARRSLLVNLSGRGDKDMAQAQSLMGLGE